MLSLPILMPDEATRRRIARDLEALAPGQVRFSSHERMLYATDASIYQVAPIGVVAPSSVEAMARVAAYCSQHEIPLLPRGGGTSLPGQCTNRALVLDHSAFCRAVLDVDAEARICHVEPGITVDELNRQLERRGLFFAPDPATAAQATIGGCIGNNAAGARSLRYGRTSESVAGVEALLTSGPRLWLEPGAGRRSAAAAGLAHQVAEVVRRNAAEIRLRFPKTSRRNAGYGLDLVLAQLDGGVAEEDLDLSGLICGSEGTLAVVLGAKLKLHAIPRSKGLVIASFGSLEEAIRAVVPILGTGPSAVELLDDVVLDAARGNAECRGYMDLLAELPGGRPPQAVLYVEYQEAGPGEAVSERFAALRTLLGGDAPVREYRERSALLRAWALRKAGEPLLHGLASHRKPVTCVEDNAVPVERLVEFVAAFKQIVARHGTRAAYYAHASVGVLHVRPMLDLHDPADRERLRAIAMEVADLARACGGVMSGEHGDGRLRGPLLERFYGRKIMGAFQEIKAIFDPQNLLNPGNIVPPMPPETITSHLRVAPEGRSLAWPAVETYYQYVDQEGFSGAVEMCNGAGVCRKTAGGTMCPSYRATMDERHATRGRANALRLAISGQLSAQGDPAWNDPETLETLSLCLSCKACKSECPSNVDVARLKAEYTAQSYKAAGRIPLKARFFGHIRRLNALGSLLPGLANRVGTLLPVRAVMNRVLHLAPQRTLPAFAPSLYRWFEARTPSAGGGPAVVLFADCFVTYNEPHIGRRAILLLESLGYRVLLPRVECCGRAMISTGLLDDAIRSADRVLGQLRPFIEDTSVRAVLACEPSCLSTMKDDWLTLKLKTDRALRERLADKAFQVEEFIGLAWNDHPISPEKLLPAVPRSDASAALPKVLMHGHCHQKALWGTSAAAATLERLVGDRLEVLPSGCCGMAGAFGYDRDKYEVSMQIGRQSLFSLLEAAPADAMVLAPGTSCRHQIHDGAHRTARHPIELIADLLGVPEA